MNVQTAVTHVTKTPNVKIHMVLTGIVRHTVYKITLLKFLKNWYTQCNMTHII